jgi:hypothetical protein
MPSAGTGSYCGGDKPPLGFTVVAFNAGARTQLWRQAH